MNNQKFTLEYIRSIIEENGDKLLSDVYENRMSRLKIQCEKCEDPYVTNIIQYRKGGRCIYCFGNKYNLKKVKRVIAEAGDELLSKEYKNNLQKLDIKCHQCKASYHTTIPQFNKGRRCLDCFGKRYNIDKVKKIIEEGGDVLISDIYENYESKLKIKCSLCNENYMMSLHKYKEGNRCRACGFKKRSEKRRKYGIDVVRDFVKEQGDELISKEYLNVKDNIIIKCNKCENDYSTTFDRYKRGGRCGYCAKTRKHTLAEVEKMVEDVGDELVSEEYININAKLDIKCGNCKETYQARLDVFKRGRRCQTCYGPKRYTHEEVEKIVSDGGDTLVGEFKNSDTKFDVKCTTCERIYSIKLHDYTTYGRRCRICGYDKAAAKRRLSYEEVKKCVNYTGEELISENYTNNKTKLTIKCQKCNNNYYLDLSHFKLGIRCGPCNKTEKLTYEYVKGKIESDGNILLSNEYKNVRTHLEIRCGKCDHIYCMKFCDYSNGHRCIECARAKRRYTFDYAKKFIEADGDILVSKEYVNSTHKLEIKCHKCKENFLMNLSSYKQGARCWRCQHQSKPHEFEYVQKLFEKNNDILLSDTYKNVKSKLRFICHRCDEEHNISLGHYRKGYRCNNSQSLGEIAIEEYLLGNGYDYEPQKRFDDCKNILPLPFDFYITVRSVDFAVEFDGKQHYEPVEIFGGEKEFLKQVERDCIKDKYCEENNIPLLRIPYWEFDRIPEVLDAFIGQLTLPKLTFKKKLLKLSFKK